MGPRDTVWVSVLKLPRFSHFPFHILRMQSQRGVSFSEFLSPRQDFPLAHQGAGKWKSSLIFFIPFVKEGSRAQSSTHFFDDRSHLGEMTTEMGAPLEESIPSTRSSHHLRMGSLSSRTISSNWIHFSPFSIWMLTIYRKLAKVGTLFLLMIIGIDASRFLPHWGNSFLILNCRFLSASRHICIFITPSQWPFFYISLLKLISKHFGVF